MAINQFRFLVYFAGLYVILALLQLLRCPANGSSRPRLPERAQLLTILAFSYLFLAESSLSFAAVVAVETVWTYVFALLIGRMRAAFGITGRRMVLLISVLLPLGLLAYYKYYNFFAGEIAGFLGVGAQSLSIAAPVGISFYTFTILGYLIDVYRGDMEAETNLADCALFIGYFPKIVSGPIVRAGEFLPQVKRYPGLSLSGLSDGLQIFLFGLFKKMVLADHLGVFVDDVFYAPAAYSTATVWLAALSYSLQIYLDFSGYSDMAVGLSKIIGFDLPRNFNLPYLSRDVSEFWTRWHITLSGWLRDYIYFPLGGSRAGTVRTYVNLLLVMLISGLWHGAGYTFLLWGLVHGVLSCLHHFHRQLRRKTSDIRRKSGSAGMPSALSSAASVLVTFLLVTLLWVVFRSEDLANMTAMFTSLFTLHEGITQPYSWTFLAVGILAAASCAAIGRHRRSSDPSDRSAEKKERDSGSVNGFYPVMKLDTIPALTLFFVMIGLTILMGYYGDTSFIYGKF